MSEFDWEIYKELNEDLKNLKFNKTQILEHWQKYGQYENRLSKVSDVTPDFNWTQYANLNPDLKKMGIITKSALELHWVRHGRKENRIHKSIPIMIQSKQSLPYNIFGNCDFNTNGEKYFYDLVKGKINVIFDIGCRDDTIFYDFAGVVHYFDCFPKFLDAIIRKSNNHVAAYYNKFGLSDENKQMYYYPTYQSFHNRHITCHNDDSKNKILLEVKTAKKYMEDNGITEVDFIKIDTEGHELHVLKGFGGLITKIKLIQFEYGGTFIDSNIKLSDITNYLKMHGFTNFSYLYSNKLIPITNFFDHYRYCNIVCFNKENINEFKDVI